MFGEKAIGRYVIPKDCRQLGHGSFAFVLLGHEVEDPSKKAAVKVILKSKLHYMIWQKELAVLKNLKGLQHSNLVNLLHFEDSKDHLFLVTEFCNGGDLQKYLADAKIMAESSVAHLLRHMACALDGLKKLNVVHRDLKPANILMCYTTVPRSFTDITFKIADFGFAKVLSDNMMTATVCGSPVYMAPEVFAEVPYSNKADLWSLGVITYQCLIGTVPFMKKSYPELAKFFRSNKCKVELPSHLCTEICDLIFGLLAHNPQQRISFEEFFSHPFLKLMPGSSIFKKAGKSFQLTQSRPRTISENNQEMSENKRSNKENVPIYERENLAGEGTERRPVQEQVYGSSMESALGRMAANSTTLKDFVVVQKKWVPDRNMCNVPYGPVTTTKSYFGTATIEYAAVKNKSDAYIPLKSTDGKANKSTEEKTAENSQSGCSVDPPSVGRSLACGKENLKRKNQEINETWKADMISSSTCDVNVLLNEFKAPTVQFLIDNKKAKTQLGSSVISVAAERSYSTSSLQSLILGRSMSLGSIFDDPAIADLFACPELDEKVLMEPEELEMVGKLEYLTKLTKYMSQLCEHGKLWAVTDESTPLLHDEDKLVLFTRCLLLIKSAIDNAKRAYSERKISLSRLLKKLLRGLKDCYNECLKKSRKLKEELVCGEHAGASGNVKGAETLLYFFALEASREAAKAEMMSDWEKCCLNYDIAYVFLHWVELKASNHRVKEVLKTYKDKVEKRLNHFKEKGLVACS